MATIFSAPNALFFLPPILNICGDTLTERGGENIQMCLEPYLGIQYPKMSQPSDSYNPNLLAGAASILLQGAIQRDAAAKHGRRMLTADLVGDFNYESGRMTGVIGIAAVRFGLVGVCRVVGIDFKGTHCWCVKMGAFKALCAQTG